MSSKEINCWEFMKCGRGDGQGTSSCKTCPAALDTSFDGINDGKNAGRSCWLVAGTFCKGKPAGTFSEKLDTCKNCEFYKQIQSQEKQSSICIKNIDIAAYTHIGLVKSSNEDRYLVKKMADDALLLSVADGLGGDVSSDVAAEIARGKLATLQPLPKGKESKTLFDFVKELDHLISKRAESQEELSYMATTLVAIVLKSDKVHWLNVGDSRFYIARDRQLLQITDDHTLARALVEDGELTPEEAKTHYSRKIVDQCVGYGACEPETGRIEIRKDDYLVLSTDGLHKMIDHKKILSILIGRGTLKEKTETLMDAALKSGGKDNITIVLAHIKKDLTA